MFARVGAPRVVATIERELAPGAIGPEFPVVRGVTMLGLYGAVVATPGPCLLIRAFALPKSEPELGDAVPVLRLVRAGAAVAVGIGPSSPRTVPEPIELPELGATRAPKVPGAVLDELRIPTEEDITPVLWLPPCVAE